MSNTDTRVPFGNTSDRKFYRIIALVVAIAVVLVAVVVAGPMLLAGTEKVAQTTGSAVTKTSEAVGKTARTTSLAAQKEALHASATAEAKRITENDFPKATITDVQEISLAEGLLVYKDLLPDEAPALSQQAREFSANYPSYMMLVKGTMDGNGLTTLLFLYWKDSEWGVINKNK